MANNIVKKLVWLRNYLIFKKYDFLAKIYQNKFRVNPEANFVVSIASYPQRSHLLPAIFEALNGQTMVPQKWILVLSEEEWPNLILPGYLKKIVNRGVEIVWVKYNTYAVKKLVPVLKKFPQLGVITLDDDILYEDNLISNLINHSMIRPGCIVGHVGKTLFRKNNELNMMFREKRPTNSQTNHEQVFLIGWGGIYYPANSLSHLVTDIEAIRKIVPGRGSDIWFWAAAIANKTKQYCIDPYSNNNLGVPIHVIESTKPKDSPGGNILEQRFQMTIDFFDIRKKLIDTLPNKG